MLTAHLAMWVVALAYAFNYFIAKQYVFSEVSPFALLSVRGASGLLFFGLIGLFLIKEKIDKKDWPRFVACGLFGVAINQTFFLWGLSKTSPINSSAIMVLTPVFVFLIAWILKQEKMGLVKLLGLGLSFLGALLLSIYGKNLDFGNETIAGDIMIAINACSYALYLVLVRPLALKYNTFTIIMYIFLFGGGITILLGMPDLLQVSWSALPNSAVLGMIYVVVFATLLAYSLNAWAMKRVPSSQVGIYVYLQPALVTILTPLLLLEGSIHLQQLLYIFMILTGVWLVNKK